MKLFYLEKYINLKNLKNKIMKDSSNFRKFGKPQNIDIKKQKRLSDAGNIGFIMPPENMEEFKRSQEKTVAKPHSNSYEPVIFLHFFCFNEFFLEISIRKKPNK